MFSTFCRNMNYLNRFNLEKNLLKRWTLQKTSTYGKTFSKFLIPTSSAIAYLYLTNQSKIYCSTKTT